MTSDQQTQTVTFTKPTDREIQAERVFNAPRDRVFATFTDPTLIPEWWGQTTIVDQMDVRPGGSWRFVVRNEKGYETAFRGEYHEVDPPERIVQTFEWEGMPGHIQTQTYAFEDLGETTRMSITMLFDTTQERDGMFRADAEGGMSEAYDRLDALLARLGSS